MNARSPLETMGSILLGAVLGAVICWFYRNDADKAEANKTLSIELASFQAAAPEIAKAAAQLQRTATAYGALTREYAEIKPTLAALAACPVPAEYDRLLRAQDAEINATGDDDKARAADMRSDSGN